jgi:hypothetical protein
MRPGTPFVVTDRTKDGTYIPGTTGFISCVKGRDRDYPNVVFYTGSIIRRGKAGKPRLDGVEISTPVFDIDHEAMAEFMPAENRRYYVHLDRAVYPNDLLQYSKLGYLGWAFAYARYTKKLCDRATRFSPWPKGNKDLVNNMLIATEYYEEDSENAFDYFCKPESIRSFIHRIRMTEATVARCYLSYTARVAQLEEEAIVDLAKRHSKDHQFARKADLTATVKYHQSKTTVLNNLSSKHGKLGASKSAVNFLASWS